jgi:hypothetical protein
MIATQGIYNSVVVERTVTEPVTLTEAKDWAKIDFTDDDALITLMITAARQDIENYCGVKLVDSSVTAYLNVKCADDEFFQFPSAIRGMVDESSIVINRLTKGSDDVLQVLDTDYYLSNGLSLNGTGKYRIEYDIVAANIPETLKEAIKMLVAYRYDNRGDQKEQKAMPDDVESKIMKYQQIWL